MEMIIFRKLKSGERGRLSINDEIDDVDDITMLFERDVKKIFKIFIELILFHILMLLVFYTARTRLGEDNTRRNQEIL